MTRREMILRGKDSRIFLLHHTMVLPRRNLSRELPLFKTPLVRVTRHHGRRVHVWGQEARLALPLPVDDAVRDSRYAT